VHCLNPNYSFVVGNPRISGSIVCNAPRTYNVTLTNLNTINITVSYKIYIDDGDQLYDPIPGHDTLITPIAAGPYVITPGSGFNSGNLDYFPFSSLNPWAGRGLWVEVLRAIAS
jgi:hypothetical protein